MKTKILLALFLSLAPLGRSAESLYLSAAEAAKRGIRVELITPKPRIVQVTLHFTEAPIDVALVICDAKDNFIAVVGTAISGNSCTATLNEDYVARSYFLVPNSAKSGETQVHVYLR